MTFSPKHNQRCRLLTHTALGKPENTRGKGGQAPDLAPRGTRGYYNKHPRFWWKKVLWKHYLFKKKKSRNCIELRKWHDIITYFCPSEPPPRSSVWFLHASSRKRLYYNIIWQIQLNLHFQRRLRSPQAARTVRDAWANDQEYARNRPIRNMYDPVLWLIPFCLRGEMDNFPSVSQHNHLQTSSVKILHWLEYI